MAGAEFPVRAVLDDRGVDQLIAALTKVAKQAGLSEKEIKEMNDELRRTGKEGVNSVNNINKGMNNLVNDGIQNVGKALLVAFAVDRLVAYAKEVAKITGEYEKFEAVLANTLGSKGAARAVLNEISAFAAKTPFSVRELTENFIKLANRGVKPTLDQLRAMGDLSATLGKPVEQLVEALLDVNNPERWKELGIVSKTAGDKVELSFRGMTIEADRTVESVTEAAVTLGNLEGVAGSMQAISETLAGSISNMGDNLETFANNLGKYNRGPIGAFFTIINEGLAAMNERMALANMTATDFAEIGLKRFRDRFDEVSKAFKATGDSNESGLNLFFQDVVIAANSANEEIAQTSKRLEEINKHGIRTDTREEFEKLTARLPILKAELTGYKEIQEGLLKVVKEHTEKVAPLDEKAMKKKAKYLQELADLSEKYRQHLVDLHNEEREGLKINEKELQGLEDRLTDRQGLTLGVQLDPSVDDDEELIFDGLSKDEWEQKLRDKEDFKRNLLLDSFDFAVGLIETMQQIQDQRDRDEINALDAKRNYELSLAGDNAKAKDRINKEFDQKERELKRKQAETDREQALFNIAIDTARAIVAALPNVYLSALAAATGLAQAAIVSTRPLPKFAHGVFDLQGPGTETSDSINARLSKHETVVPAYGTKRFPDLLRAIVENPNLTYADVRNIVDKHVPTHLRNDIRATKVQEGELKYKLDEVNRNLVALQNKRESHISIDENGFKKWTRSGESWTQYVNKRYRF